MRKNKKLKIEGTLISKTQLEEHLQKIAGNHNLNKKSSKNTYPVPNMLENFKFIQQVYNLLNEHVKLGIGIHPAGEWLLDNLYIIEETVKQIKKELSLKKYINFVGLENGPYKGFARVYVVASEIIAYTDNKIDRKDLEDYLKSYQTKKTLSMEEIWNIGTFLQIAIIENIREICEKIYSEQIQKYKVENIAERLIERKKKQNLIFKTNGIIKNIKTERKVLKNNMQNSFIEYMSYILKRYGKKGAPYLRILEEIVEMKGSSISEIIKKEHFDIALRKVSIGNSIVSIKKIQRINFLEIFEKINEVEEVLKKDPIGIYEKMDDKTKEYYRNSIEEISKKTKISEIYIAKKVLELSRKNVELDKKKSHIGYYLIDKGIDELYENLQYKQKKKLKGKTKVKLYLLIISFFSVLISYGVLKCLNIGDIWINILSFILLLVPSSEVGVLIIQYILSKIVKPKLIPKLNFSNGINKENATFVVIPTILSSKKKVKELINKLEVFYLANKSENLYFALLGDCTESKNEKEPIDEEIIKEGINQIEELNEKYNKHTKEIGQETNIFNFIYRKRVWNEKEESYLGWERKRGMLTQFNEYLLGNIENPFRVNTLEENKIPKIKYIITLDADTDLILNSGFELVGAMAHILNKPNIKDGIVVDGYGIMQPRVGINLDINYKTLFTKIFAGAGGIDSYTNAISDIYQDNFSEGIFTGKGIYDLEVYSNVLKGQIPDNSVLSHDLLEGCYLRCGLVSDVLLMDGYPTKYNSFMNRLSRWIRGDWQIIKWLKKDSQLNLLSKYKIFDNLRRSIFEISIIILFIYINLIEIIFKRKMIFIDLLIILISTFPYILEILNTLVFRKEGEERQKTFTPKISGTKGAIFRAIITFICIPYKAYVSSKSIIKTIYRMLFTHKHLLEWMTSEEAEKQAKSNLVSYYKQMLISVVFSAIVILTGLLEENIPILLFGTFWILAPIVAWYISKEEKEKQPINKLTKDEKDYLKEVGEKTWKFFKDYMIKEYNYLITDNYQEDRKEKIVERTSSTNIGLSLIAVISAYDLGYIDLSEAIKLLNNIITTINELQKWNGHLYNWYNTKTKEPLLPRYISTVDSGNFVRLFIYSQNLFRREVK